MPREVGLPPHIHELLSADWFDVAARAVLTSFFWIAGLVGVMKFGKMVKVVEGHGVPAAPAVAVAMIVTELAGSLLLVTDYASLGWLGAGWLGVFTVLSIPLGHPSGSTSHLRKWKNSRWPSSI